MTPVGGQQVGVQPSDMATRKRKRHWNADRGSEMFPELHGGKPVEPKPSQGAVDVGHSTSDFASRPKAEPPKPKG